MTAMDGALGRLAARGAAWTFGATAGARVASLVGIAVLARLLAPEEFGLVAFALVFIVYTETIGDLGTGAALIHWKDREQDAARVAFWVNLAMGALWFVAMVAMAPLIAAFFRNPEAEPVLRALAWTFPIKALGNTHDALLQRRLRFRARALPELAQAISKMLVAVPLAFLGFGAWSLVWAQLASLALWTVLVWAVMPWRPGFRLPLDMLRSMLGYGRGIIAVNVLAAVVHHADLVIVGRILGAAALGFYQLAYKIPEMTVVLLVRVASRVVFPAFSRLNATGGIAALRTGYLAALRYVALFAVPAALGLAALAEPAVLTVFGEAWAPTIPILQALALYMGLRALGTNAGDLLKATGRPGTLALLALAKAMVVVPVLCLVGPRGAAAVAMSLAGLTVVSTGVDLLVACRLMGLTARDLAAALRPAAVGSVAMAPALMTWSWLAADLAPAAGLVGGVALGAAVYLSAVHLHDPQVLRFVRASMGIERERAPALAGVTEVAR
jgi:O-antigen/teichoic acid export membrane protein